MGLLIQFLLRLTFGLAAGMAITSSRKVTAGYFRNHLYVTLGLATLATFLSRTAVPSAFWPALLAAIFSYVGSVIWLYEKPGAGRVALVLVMLCGLTGSLLASAEVISPEVTGENDFALVLRQIAPVSSGLLLGVTMASMLLGHWYLNTPTMELRPLRRLLVAMGVATGLQIVVAGLGLWGEIAHVGQFDTSLLMFVALRWTFGLIGVAMLIVMTWKTLDIPNTQSATGLLYVAVIGTFVGETMGLLLSSESLFPL
jgi:hypothetical protein